MNLKRLTPTPSAWAADAASSPASPPLQRRSLCLWPLAAAALSACGGGDNDKAASNTPSANTTAPPSNDAAGQPSSGIQPMPLISRGRPVYTNNNGNPALAVDGVYQGSEWVAQPTAGQAQWLAIDIGTGPQRVVLNWSAWNAIISTPNTPPAAYRIETSANSTNGADGQWTLAVDVTNNQDAWRSHPVAFAGQRWIRLGVTAGSPSQQGRAVFHEIDVHDASAGMGDTWLFVGDSITAASFVNTPDGVAQRLHTAHPTFWPVMLNTGISGTTATQGLARLEHLLTIHSHITHWVVSYGTNDAGGRDPMGQLSTYIQSMRAIATRLKSAGKTVFMPLIPWRRNSEGHMPAYNQALSQLRTELGVIPGPDLYTHFLNHPDHMYDDGYHPNPVGRSAINQLWFEVLNTRYPAA